MSSHLIIEDPYVKRKERDLRRFLKRLSLPLTEGSVASYGELDSLAFTYQGQLSYTTSEVPNQLLVQLRRKIKNLSTNVTRHQLDDVERLIEQLPQYSWCLAIKRDLEIPKKKLTMKQQLAKLQKKLSSEQSLSADGLKRISRQFKRIASELNELSTNDADDPDLTRWREELAAEITKKQSELFKENPVRKVAALSHSFQPEIENVRDTLAIRENIRQHLPDARTFAAIELDPAQRTEYRRTLSKVRKAYDHVTEWLILHVHHFDDKLIVELMNDLQLEGLELLKDKQAFAAYLRNDLQQPFLSEKEGLVRLQEQLILFLLKNATDRDQFTKGILLMKHRPLNRLSTDNQKAVAESFYAEYQSKLATYHSLEDMKHDLQPYIERIERIMTAVNKAITLNQLIPHLQEVQGDAETECVNKETARQIMLKAAIKPYRSLKVLQNDIKKAQMGEELVAKARKNIPFLYTKKSDDQYTFYFHHHEHNDQLEKLYIKAKDKRNTNTITLID